MPEDKKETQEQPKDLLEQLLVVAAEKAAAQQAEDALRKGYVTREQINMALDTFGKNLETTMAETLLGHLEDKMAAAVKKALESDETLAKTGLRKSTIATPEDERDADPVAYLLKKGRTAASAGKDPDYDDVEKRILWEMTYRALSSGMILDQREAE